ncbi:hypothetical protein ACFYWS_38980 [Streptomyces sp. NPDC002795]
MAHLPEQFFELGAHYRLNEDIDTLVDLGGNTGLSASYLRSLSP